MLASKCLCGAVTWESPGSVLSMWHCHCSRCRKAHGVGFASYALLPAEGFQIHGEEHVERRESSPGRTRSFCRRCGSVVPAEPDRGNVYVPVGNVLGDPGARPAAHIFAASRAPWDAIHDELPRFDAFPPGVDAPVLPDGAPLDPPGPTRGSCLCGGVAFVLESPPVLARNCHCSRCRAARSAAHASNLLVPADALRFTRGEDALRSYKIPEAQFFMQVFCGACGAKMPRLDRGRGIAVVPMGSLDDDPGIRPREHIFTGSKAPWFEIADDLPRYEAQPPPA